MATLSPVIVWFRDDLRLSDNPALSHAAESGAPVLCIFVMDESAPNVRPLGGASRWWLAGSLRALDKALRTIGGELHVFSGDQKSVVLDLAQRLGASNVVWNRRHGRAETTIDAEIKAALKDAGHGAESFNGHLLNEPWTITSKVGGPVKVFSPYWRAAMSKGPPAMPLPAPSRIEAAKLSANGGSEPTAIDRLGLEPTSPDWAGGLRAEWTRGEEGALARLDAFIDHAMDGYAAGRNRPDLPATSKLSPHLRFGEISVRQCWHAATHAHASGRSKASSEDVDTFLKELGWREFSYHLLHHNPELATVNYTARFNAFPWRQNEPSLNAWQRGRTGYPIVDAGMRQLYASGWMHNRVRMIVGSFLVKHLLTDWRAGEAWFWDTLVDADPANNAASWQWVAGTGADAAPYFRVFNPIIQGEKFDPDGTYVRAWVPELGHLPTNFIHKPWTAPPAALRAVGIVLGQHYPQPLVPHETARDRALDAFKSLKLNQ